MDFLRPAPPTLGPPLVPSKIMRVAEDCAKAIFEALILNVLRHNAPVVFKKSRLEPAKSSYPFDLKFNNNL